MRPTRRAAIGAVLVAAVFGCQLIVSSDVPDFTCGSAATASCPAGLVCDVASGKCVQSTGNEAGDDTSVPDAERDGGKDGPAVLLAVGESCSFDLDCADALCAGSNILTTAVIAAGTSSVCTKTCCTSADCPAGYICFGPGTGGNYCVASEKAARALPGAKTPGQTCGGNGECRSGLCTTGKCVDTCCNPSECGGGTTCRVSTVSGHDSWACAAPNTGPDAGNIGQTCSNQDNCKNDNCLGSGASRSCRPTCCSTASCTSQGFGGAHCRYVPSGLDQLKSCEPNIIDGGTRVAVGVTCAADSDCQNDFCDPETKKCALPCCQDDDCGTGETCRPSRTSTPFLRCVKGG